MAAHQAVTICSSNSNSMLTMAILTLTHSHIRIHGCSKQPTTNLSFVIAESIWLAASAMHRKRGVPGVHLSGLGAIDGWSALASAQAAVYSRKRAKTGGLGVDKEEPCSASPSGRNSAGRDSRRHDMTQASWAAMSRGCCTSIDNSTAIVVPNHTTGTSRRRQGR